MKYIRIRIILQLIFLLHSPAMAQDRIDSTSIRHTAGRTFDRETEMLIEGTVEYRTNDGRIYKEEHYSRGKLDGVVRYFSHDGDCTYEETWRDGSLNGTARRFDNGRCIEFKTYCDNSLDGEYWELDPDVEIITKGCYIGDKKNGIWTRESEGRVLERVVFDNGRFKSSLITLTEINETRMQLIEELSERLKATKPTKSAD